MQSFIGAGKLILGVCNGFQIMTRLGLLPGLGGDYFTPRVSLMQNDCGAFQNFWVTLCFEPRSPCVFTRGIDTLPVPIRHGDPDATADVVVFDLARVRDTATYDKPHQLAEGMVHVVVNGKAAIAGGALTPERAGRLLRWDRQ